MGSSIGMPAGLRQSEESAACCIAFEAGIQSSAVQHPSLEAALRRAHRASVYLSSLSLSLYGVQDHEPSRNVTPTRWLGNYTCTDHSPLSLTALASSKAKQAIPSQVSQSC